MSKSDLQFQINTYLNTANLVLYGEGLKNLTHQKANISLFFFFLICRSIISTITPIYIQRKPIQTGSGMYSHADVISLPSWCHYYSHLCSLVPRLFLDCNLAGTTTFDPFHSSLFYIHQCSPICQKTCSETEVRPTLILSCGRAVVLP